MKRKLRLCYGNKGFVFTLDVLVASIILIIFVIFSSLYLEEADYNVLQMKRTGYDTVLMLDYNGSLKSLNENVILKDMELFLPENYDMRILLNGMTIGDKPKGDVVSGVRFFYINNSEFGYLKYYTWLK